MSRVQHPGVARVHDFGIDGDVAYLVMELLEGLALDQLIAEQSPLPHDACALITCQVLATLSVLHEMRVIHRDIKPANVFVTAAVDHPGVGVAKLLDFGLSRETRLSASRITDVGLLNDTPRYISPERLLGDDASRRSDVYAVAVVLYEMLAGEMPFRVGGLTVPQIFDQILHGERVPILARRADVPAEFANVVDRGARVHGARGFDTAATFLLAIDRSLGGRFIGSDLSRTVPMSSAAVERMREVTPGASTLKLRGRRGRRKQADVESR